MRAIDLFSCIGGHALGLQAAGIEVVGLCEVHPQRRAFLQLKFPHIPVSDDVRTIDAVCGSAEILTGGPPCQETSVGAAIHGKRTGRTLWGHMLRFGCQLGPRWWVIEQPPGHARWEAQVRGDLERAGYCSARFKLSAQDLGAPHLRRRVFILAHTRQSGLALAGEALASEVARCQGSTAAGNHWAAGPPELMRVVDGVSPWLDRNAAVEAIGDSNPPQMMTVIARAILAAEVAL